MTISVLMAPEGPPAGGGPAPITAVDETAQDLADLSDVEPEAEDSDDEDEAEADETEVETDEESEDATDEDEEDETSGEDEEDEEDGEPERLHAEPRDVQPPTVRAVKEKYPNFFKEFPGLRQAFFEHPKYQEIFPDVESASSAAQKAEEFDALENSLVGRGDASTLFKVLAQNSPQSLKKLISGLPDAVRAIDDNTYTLLAQPIIEELIYHANAHGEKTNNKNLILSARHLANFVFANGGDIPDISSRKKSAAPSEAEVELARERQHYAQEKFDSAMNEIGGSISQEMNRFLDHKLDGLSKFEKTQIIKETRLEIDRVLSSDKGFQNLLAGLWKRARDSGYSAESKSKLRRAWLDRARLIAPKIRAKYKEEALSGRAGKSGEQGEKKIVMKRQFPEKGGAAPSHSKRTVLDPKKIDWRKTSDMDILNSK